MALNKYVEVMGQAMQCRIWMHLYTFVKNQHFKRISVFQKPANERSARWQQTRVLRGTERCIHSWRVQGPGEEACSGVRWDGTDRNLLRQSDGWKKWQRPQGNSKGMKNIEEFEDYYANVPCWSCRQNAWHWRSAKVWNIISLDDANFGQLPQLPESNERQNMESPPVTSHHGRNLKTEIERALGHASFKEKTYIMKNTFEYIWNVLKYFKTYSAFDWQWAGLDLWVCDTGHSLICNEDSSWGNRLNCGSKRTLGRKLKWNMSERSIFTLKCWFETSTWPVFICEAIPAWSMDQGTLIFSSQCLEMAQIRHLQFGQKVLCLLEAW